MKSGTAQTRVDDVVLSSPTTAPTFEVCKAAVKPNEASRRSGPKVRTAQ